MPSHRACSRPSQAFGERKSLQRWRRAVRGCRSAPALAVHVVALSDALHDQDFAGGQPLIAPEWWRGSSKRDGWYADARAATLSARQLGTLVAQLVASRIMPDGADPGGWSGWCEDPGNFA
jgi:hypothetical protein